MDIWKKFTDLFTRWEESSPTQPLLHEMIERSEAQKADYAAWKEGIVCRQLCDWLARQYGLFRALPTETDAAVDFLDNRSVKGFVIYFDRTNYNLRDVTFFFDYLKEKVLQLNYRTQISDRRAFQRNDRAETIERHYLKPAPDFSGTGKLNQKFGNITIESVLHDEQPYQLKFRAVSYNDALFREAESFGKLMLLITEKE